MIAVSNISAGYADKIVLKDVSFEVAGGEFLGIIGPNGSGKSTLLKAMTRIIKPHSGNVLYDGKDMQNIPLKEISRKVAFVPQETFSAFSYSVLDIVLLGRTPHLARFENETKRDFEVIENSLALTDCAGLIDRNIDSLSAGERQRVFISKALAQEPELLILDEPTSHLDIRHQVEIFDIIERLNATTGLTVITVLHDLNLASEYCSRLILLNDGKIYADGLPDEVINYRYLEDVYKTPVVVKENPVSGKPFVFLVSESNLTKKEGEKAKLKIK